MRIRDILLLLAFGVAFWAAGTAFYAKRGAAIFETTSHRFAINLVLTPIVTSVVCVLILSWMGVPASRWASAMLLVAIPGMVGEAVLLLRFSVLMPALRATSAGKYGAFLFATYALVLSIAEIVTLRAAGASR